MLVLKVGCHDKDMFRSSHYMEFLWWLGRLRSERKLLMFTCEQLCMNQVFANYTFTR